MSDTSLSGVGGGPAEALPKLANSSWELSCRTLSEKAELLAYANSINVPIHDSILIDRDKHLEWWVNLAGKGAIWANPQREKKACQLTAEQFKAMCDAYAAAR